MVDEDRVGRRVRDDHAAVQLIEHLRQRQALTVGGLQACVQIENRLHVRRELLQEAGLLHIEIA